MGPYFAYVASAYAFSGLALAGLGLWAFLDARSARAELKILEAAARRARKGEP